MFALLKRLFSRTENPASTFEELKTGDEFTKPGDVIVYVKTSPGTYCENAPINSYSSLKWRMVNEDFDIIKV